MVPEIETVGVVVTLTVCVELALQPLAVVPVTVYIVVAVGETITELETEPVLQE